MREEDVGQCVLQLALIREMNLKVIYVDPVADAKMGL